MNSHLLHFFSQCLFFPEGFYCKQFQFRMFESNCSHILISFIQSRLLFIFCLFSLIMSPPVFLPFLQFIYIYFFFLFFFVENLRTSVHCFLKFWARSSENKLQKLCVVLYLECGVCSREQGGEDHVFLLQCGDSVQCKLLSAPSFLS